MLWHQCCTAAFHPFSIHADPANPTRKEWLHWMVTNIPAAGDVGKGQEVGLGLGLGQVRGGGARKPV